MSSFVIEGCTSWVHPRERLLPDWAVKLNNPGYDRAQGFFKFTGGNGTTGYAKGNIYDLLMKSRPNNGLNVQSVGSSRIVPYHSWADFSADWERCVCGYCYVRVTGVSGMGVEFYDDDGLFGGGGGLFGGES
jgi:hypothetical protein